MKKIISILFGLLVSLSLFASEYSDTTIVNVLKFQYNKSEFVDGDSGYKTFVNETLPYFYKNVDRVDSIIVQISSSPEGTKVRNSILTEERARKVLDYFPDNIYINVELIEENYNGIVEHVDSTNRSFIESIISSGNNLKKRLLNLPYVSGTLPNLRYAKVEIRFSATEPIEPIHDTIINTQIDTIYIDRIDTVYIEKDPRIVPVLAVKTNLLADALITPNVHAELYTHFLNTSLEFEYTFPWWSTDVYHKYYQILSGTAGIRRYFKDTYNGHYIGAYINTTIYDIEFSNDPGYQGEGYGFGISYGYVFNNKKHPRLKFEPFVRVGYFYTKFDTYHTSEPFDGKYYYNWYKKASDFVPRRLEMNYFGPTMIGFNLTYDLICLRRY